VYPYHALKTVNVDGTREILRLATHRRPVSLYYVSTVSVFDSLPYFEADRVIAEDEVPGHPSGLMYGYAQSKWVAERMVLTAEQRGLPVTIFRPGTVIGDSRTGYWNSGDYLGRLIIGCIQLGLVPNIDQTLWLSPVDFVSKAMVHLSRTKAAGGPYHVIARSSIRLTELFELIRELGYGVRLISLSEWQTALLATGKDNALYPIQSLFTEPVSTEEPRTIFELLEMEPEYTTDRFEANLAGSGIVSSPLNIAVWERYLHHLQQR
jgi:thioester reductase-like protein